MSGSKKKVGTFLNAAFITNTLLITKIIKRKEKRLAPFLNAAFVTHTLLICVTFSNLCFQAIWTLVSNVADNIKHSICDIHFNDLMRSTFTKLSKYEHLTLCHVAAAVSFN